MFNNGEEGKHFQKSQLLLMQSLNCIHDHNSKADEDDDDDDDDGAYENKVKRLFTVPMYIVYMQSKLNL